MKGLRNVLAVAEIQVRLWEGVLKSQLREVLMLDVVSIIRLNVLLDVRIPVGQRTKLQVVDVEIQSRELVIHVGVKQRVRAVVDRAVDGSDLDHLELELRVPEHSGVDSHATVE